MKVFLGGEDHSGEEILAAFRCAAKELARPGKEWVAENFFRREKDISRYEVREGRLCILGPELVGLNVVPQYLIQRKEWFIFGKRVVFWGKDSNTSFIVAPLNPYCNYKEVEVWIDIRWLHTWKSYDTPEKLGGTEAKRIGPDFEKFIVDFVKYIHRSRS